MRFRFSLILFAFAFPAHAEQVTIPWKQNFTYTSDEVFTPDKAKAGVSGRTFRFMNGAPEENKKVEKTGSLAAQFLKPRGATGPVPVVILMHGCNGLSEPVVRWAREKGKMLLDQGVGVLVLDSFGQRGVAKTCGAPNYHWAWRRVGDAYSALAWLVENNHAIPDRVYILGRSNGGATALMLASTLAATGNTHKFAASFAISPACNEMEKLRFALPVTIFVGDKDMAADAQLCAKIDGKDGFIKAIIFKGVHHGYEDRGPASIFNGWRIEYNQKADEATMNKVLEVIKSPRN